MPAIIIRGYIFTLLPRTFMRWLLPGSQELPGVFGVVSSVARAGVTRYCGVAPSTPGRLGYGDISGREIPERRTCTGPGFGWLPSRGHELHAAQ